MLRTRNIGMALLLATAGCGGADGTGSTAREARSPSRPPECTEVGPQQALQAAIDAAEEGARLCLQPGEYAGPVTIARRIALWGPREAVVKSTGTGTTVLVTASGTTLEGFTVSGSG